ncbi:hypothetical protein I9W82_003154 [Candida metapsilosis]|uniref:Uncharacterized protein n=1 Tax=Candida metapsilosis TaxID=273372 RepID=A0A8H7ZIN0_9ASCO|nr:hypothetical protein I9W82_003154 [Candida metapsilosis]
MLSSHPSKLRSSSRGSTVITTTTITTTIAVATTTTTTTTTTTATITTTTTATITRQLSIPESLPNSVLLVKQFTVGPDSNLAKPLGWPKHVVKMIDQLKQTGPTKPNTTDTTDTTMCVDPGITTTKTKPAASNTTTATSFTHVTPESPPKQSLLAIDNQQVEETTKDCVPEKIC